ncbi:MAG: hypothetical protein GTO67_04840 [Gammaproteobacteria bacterium]|nr:hypothetical protein [Gammaproteobacteria bacterium]NIM71916.1 hypothetical protein [Gammaproteobacteria bacterium]NIN38038.1 hypothetical protein [Gammaproteobacteria bacterium]NIO23672.1 hypothetical protein [Gammaproteobacteria bacterium]NIO64288.1 hypothetical protein [Gammaproteobacteria bacterium]
MDISILIIDRFYDDAEVVRQRALEFDFPVATAKKNYPGRNSAQRFLPNGIDDVVSQLVHEPVEAYGTAEHGRFRLTMAEDEGDRGYYVHIDGHAHWAGILYLTPDEHCQGGTEFYRHREHATDRCYTTHAEARAHGFDDCSKFADETIERDGNDLSKWEHLMTVPMRFNRMVIFRPWFWHTAGKSFGDSRENGRLVQLFFWRSASARK